MEETECPLSKGYRTTRKRRRKMAKTVSNKNLTLVAISGLSWPTMSRKYLIQLVKDAVVKDDAKCALSAGGTIDGKHVEGELKAQLKWHLREMRAIARKNKEPFDIDFTKEQFESDFIADHALRLNAFLPVLPNGVNWHIAIAERIYDRPIGAKILEKLRDMRSDVRLLGTRREDGFYDHEPKFPVLIPDFGEIRILMPKSAPWFSKTISNLVQRLMSAYTARSLSLKPNLVIVGLTGTAVDLPSYDGVHVVSVPASGRLAEQKSTEHMIGASVIKIAENGHEGARVVNGVHNFRLPVFLEKSVSVPSSLSKVEQAAMRALLPSDASPKTVLFRMNAEKKPSKHSKNWTKEHASEALKKLVAEKLVVYSKASNQFGINEELRKNVDITMGSLWKGARHVKHVIVSCVHGGATETLYFTFIDNTVRLCLDADALIENGDLMQGIAHQYEYSGALIPISYGVDKQEIANAYMRAKILLGIFEARLKDPKMGAQGTAEEVLSRCLITYVYNTCNHDMWVYHNRGALPLKLFESTLHIRLMGEIQRLLEEHKVVATAQQIQKALATKIIRVGEDLMVELNGIMVCIKHPHKPRTMLKTGRIQEVGDWMWRTIDTHHKYMAGKANKKKPLSVTYVANYHEAAATHLTKYDRTVLGVMTGSMLFKTLFEGHRDKVIDFGPAVVTLHTNPEGQLLYSETEYVTHIDERDKKFIFTKDISTEAMLGHCLALMKYIGIDPKALPWR